MGAERMKYGRSVKIYDFVMWASYGILVNELDFGRSVMEKLNNYHRIFHLLEQLEVEKVYPLFICKIS